MLSRLFNNKANYVKTKIQALYHNGTLALQVMLLLRQVSLFCVSIILAMFFSMDDIGALESLQFLLQTFTAFWISGVLQWLLPNVQGISEKEQNAIIQKIFVSFLALSALVVVLLYAFQTFIFKTLLHQAPSPHLGLFLIYAFVFSPSYLLEYTFFIKKEYYKIFIISVLSFFFQNIALFIAWYSNGGIEIILWVWLCLALLRLLLLWQALRPFQVPIGYFSIGIALPLIVYTFIAQWAITFDTALVNYIFLGNVTMFTLFRYGSREFPFVNVLATGLSAAMSAAIAADFTQGITTLKAKSTRLMHWLFPLTLVLLYGSATLFDIAYNDILKNAYIIFNIFLLLIISRLLFPQSIALALKANMLLYYVAWVELCVNLVSSYILAQYWGLAGIAWGTWIAALVEKIIIALWLWQKKGIAFSDYTHWKWWLFYSIVLLLSSNFL